MCRVLRVSRSGFHQWRKRHPSRREREDEKLLVHIQSIHRRVRRRYGSPKVHAELRTQGVRIARKRVARLMRYAELRARKARRFRRTTDSKHPFPVAGNTLNRQFAVTAPNTVWAGDITYLWANGTWMYLAVILDLFSRRVVGWALDDNMEAELTTKALENALGRRMPAVGLLHHSDRGSQYASADYQRALKAANISCSMSRKGNGVAPV
jgi:transposase InsO family protein